jgi:hypothetical protein
VWTSYSARHAAQLIGLPESAVRSCIRAGLVGTPATVPAQLTFRDLATLRTIKALVDAGVPLPRVRRELLRIQEVTGASIAELAIEARGGTVHVRGSAVPIAGQLAFAFEPPPVDTPPGELRPIPRSEPPAPRFAPPATADQWLERARALEDSDSIAAIDAYRRALALGSECTEAWINLGRLHAENGDPASAQDCFRNALELDPAEATVYYNLGVLAQDTGNEADAIALYHRALELDPQLAEAHYNLATLFDQTGDAKAAIRHINEYRKLTR